LPDNQEPGRAATAFARVASPMVGDVAR